jgi:hypothetical protein
MTEDQLADYEARAHMDTRPPSHHRLEIDRDDALALVAEVRRLQAALQQIAELDGDCERQEFRLTRFQAAQVARAALALARKEN